ncbi:MAG: Crp/Fnr family transcriptional regulator [Clostridia bacterium]|nr:Crp/Fnr family transcriptional regulator [Clostridia bacterium]
MEILKLSACPLFAGISESDLPGLLDCLGARRMKAAKGQIILPEGLPAREVGILLSGHAQLVRTDYCGNRTILLNIAAGQLFAEAFACSKAAFLPVDVLAAEDCDFLLIDCRRIMFSCSHACTFHGRMIFNLLQLVADQNLAMHQRTLITAKRTTREKLMTYLLMQAKNAGSADFIVPFDRQGLADYLGVDRSGLSAEMSKLKKEGVLDYHKSHFHLLDVPQLHI